ncbi:hypothetical protein Tco_0586263 [Tanacetum coccineum]
MYPHQRYAIYNTLVKEEEATSFTSIRHIHQGRYGVSVPGLHKKPRRLKTYTPYLSEADHILDIKALDFQNIELTEKVATLQELNERFRAEHEKVKQHYKELYDSIKITHAKTIEKTTSLLTKNKTLKAQLKEKLQCVTMLVCKVKVLAPGTLHEIVEEARIKQPLDNALGYACFYTKRSQELLDSTEASGSKPRRNTKNTRILTPRSDNKKKVKDHPRNNRSNLKQKNCVDSSISFKHVLSTFKQVWKEIGKLFVNVGYQWKPTGRKFTLGEQCPLTRFTKSKVASLQQPKHVSSSEIVITEKLNNTSLKLLTRDKRRNKQNKATSTSIPITAETQPIDASGNILLFLLTNRTPTKIGAPNYQTLHLYLFSNAGRTYRPLVFGLRLLKTYDEESLSAQEFHEKVHRDRIGHNLFFVEQFCDSDLEVAFRKHSWYVRTEDGVELLKGSRGSNTYTISVKDMMKSSPICLLSKASENKSWLWHRQLNHLNFGTINDLARKDLAEAVATACYTQIRSLIHTRHNKTPYEIVHNKKHDLKFL